MSKSKRAIAWFAMWCDEDKSASLVPKCDVVHTPSVKVNDVVNFKSTTQDGKQKFFKGLVCDFGPEDEKNRLKRLLPELSKKFKEKDGSFHADRKRKAAVTAASKILTSRVNSKASSSSSNDNAVASPSAIQVLPSGGRNIIRESDSDDNDDTGLSSIQVPPSPNILGEDSDDSDLSFEEQQILLKLQKRQRKREAQKLKELSEGKEEVQDNSSKDDALLSHFKAIEQDCNEGDKEDGEQLKDGCVSKGNIDSKEKGDDRDESDHEPSILQIPAIHRKRKPENPVEFHGKMYLWTGKDDVIVELYDGAGVYLEKKLFNSIKFGSTSAGSMARQLMKAIFTKEALSTCSLGGNIAFGIGSTSEEDVRPSLDSVGVDAIFNYTKARQRKKIEHREWNKEMDDATIKARMRNVLCESRPKKVAKKN